MTDRELLKLAAKAAGYESKWDQPRGAKYGRLRVNVGGGWPVWNPRDDDGDALRLASVFCMDFRWDIADGELRASCIQQGKLAHPCGGEECEVFEPCAPEECRSTAVYRRATVNLAARIGRAMA